MNTTADLKKKSIKFALGTTVAAVATPEMLYFSAGSANADPNVGFNDWPVGGLTVSIQDTLGVTADCTYYAESASSPVSPPPPPFWKEFRLPAHAIELFAIPGIRTGTTWNVHVQCDDGQDTQTTHIY